MSKVTPKRPQKPNSTVVTKIGYLTEQVCGWKKQPNLNHLRFIVCAVQFILPTLHSM